MKFHLLILIAALVVAAVVLESVSAGKPKKIKEKYPGSGDPILEKECYGWLPQMHCNDCCRRKQHDSGTVGMSGRCACWDGPADYFINH